MAGIQQICDKIVDDAMGPLMNAFESEQPDRMQDIWNICMRNVLDLCLNYESSVHDQIIYTINFLVDMIATIPVIITFPWCKSLINCIVFSDVRNIADHTKICYHTPDKSQFNVTILSHIVSTIKFDSCQFYELFADEDMPYTYMDNFIVLKSGIVSIELDTGMFAFGRDSPIDD